MEGDLTSRARVECFFDIKRGVRTNLTSEFTESFRLVDVAENFRRFPAFTVADD